jgi:hypothetical protein
VPPDLPDIPKVEAAIIEMTNRVRVGKSAGPVKPNAGLSAAARAYAAYLANTGKFSHDADGRQAGERITAAGYEWCLVGENLSLAESSAGFKSDVLAEKAVEGWLNSPGHRENLLQPHVTEIGVGVAKAPGKDLRFISVQLFGRPKSMTYEFQVSNATTESVTYSFGGELHEVKPSFAMSMTACLPSAITFERIGAGAKAKALAARFEAADGMVYMVKPDKAEGAKVEATVKENVR